MQTLTGRRILLIISGGIAAYKSLDLIRRLRDRGAAVRCILTAGGAQFITPLSVAALSENTVHTELFSLTQEAEMGHIRLARDCDLVLVAPASANLLARTAQGMADDLASTVLLATDAPVMMAPAMNPVMLQNAAVQDNIDVLQRRGVRFIAPGTGVMACGETGAGRLAEVADIVAAVEGFFQQNAPLKGLRALVTSGPTFEPLDPVRFIGNRSSGRQGHAIAEALALAGAHVTLISGPVSIPPPRIVDTIHVGTAREMYDACMNALPADIAVCAAAVADFRAEAPAGQKIKKSGDEAMTLRLVQNPDILAALSQGNQRPKLVVGFAAETQDLLQNAAAKLARKGCDWLVLNDVAGGRVFGQDDNAVTVLRAGGASETWGPMDKKDVAKRLAADIAAQFAA